jgi:hypothetical protein
LETGSVTCTTLPFGDNHTNEILIENPPTKRMNPTGSAHQALPVVGLRGLSLAGYPLQLDALSLRPTTVCAKG